MLTPSSLQEATTAYHNLIDSGSKIFELQPPRCLSHMLYIAQSCLQVARRSRLRCLFQTARFVCSRQPWEKKKERTLAGGFMEE
ncbi:hypothetical protein HHX47_DHR9000308 [Lentinula edodes]|nr:hypothetical protein HHX47_DHR9000308 [Lentinula edodes]